MAEEQITKKDFSRVRSSLRKIEKIISDNPKLSKEGEAIKKEMLSFWGGTGIAEKSTNPFTGAITGNYWTQTGYPWVSSEGRKAVLTEWFWQPVRGQPRRVDTNELRQYSQDFWISACINTLVDEISSLDWDIVEKENIVYESVEPRYSLNKRIFKIPK